MQLARILSFLSIIAFLLGIYILSEIRVSENEDLEAKKRRLRNLFSVQLALLILLALGDLVFLILLTQSPPAAAPAPANLAPWWNALKTSPGQAILLGLLVYLALAGIYPLTYLAYRQVVSGTQKKRLTEDLMLLGLYNTEENARHEAEELYEMVYSPKQYNWYILLIMLVSALVLLGFVYPAKINVEAMDKNVLWLVFYAYLGAYVFSIQELVRRFNTEDLRPQVYSSILVRTLVAMAVTFVGAQILLAFGTNLGANNADASSAAPEAWAAILAFLIGIFPKSGIEWFQKLAKNVLSTPTEVNLLPVRNIQGISTWHESRLLEMGIDDVQNLATVDIRRMLLSTRFDIQEIINWIDQAILYAKVRDKYPRFKDAAISTFHEFRLRLAQANNSGMDGASGNPDADKSNLAVRLGLAVNQDLDYLADTSTYSNYSFISQYYRSVPDLARRRSEAGREELGITLRGNQTDEQRIFSKLQAESQARIDQDPQDAEAWANLGLSQFKLAKVGKDYEDAYSSLQKAVALNSNLPNAFSNLSRVCLLLHKWDEARNYATREIDLNPNNKYPYLSRGLALMELNEPDKAILDFERAINLDDHYGEAYNHRGIVYNRVGQFEKAAADLDMTYWLLTDHSDPKFWLERGTAYLGLARQKEKSAQGSGIAHAHTAIEYLTNSIARAESAEAYWKRGLAYFLMESQEPATRDYLKAIAIAEQQKNPDRYNIYLLLGEAYWKAGRFPEACAAFQNIAEHAPAGSGPAVSAAMYLILPQCSGTTTSPGVPPAGAAAGSQPAEEIQAPTTSTPTPQALPPPEAAAPSDPFGALMVENLKQLGIEVTWNDRLEIYAKAVLGEDQVRFPPNKLAELAKNTGITPDQISQASLMTIPGVDPAASALLLASGVTSTSDLRERTPQTLLELLQQTSTDQHLLEQAPDLEKVRSWIAEAQKLAPRRAVQPENESTIEENAGTIEANEQGS